MAPPPLVSLVTVTWNAPGYVRRFYDSVAARTREPYELIVVDNASDAPTRALNAERAARGEIRLIQNEENVLWAKGCNQGLAVAGRSAEFVALVNPDCEVLREDWIARFRAVLDRDPKVAVTGPFLNWKRIGPVFGCVDGSVFFMRREALDAIGLLDAERYPWNGSPYDWCARAFARGWIYRRTPNDPPSIVHHGHKSVEASGQERPWVDVDVEEMYRRAGLRPERPHRLGVWLRRRVVGGYFFDPAAPVRG